MSEVPPSTPSGLLRGPLLAASIGGFLGVTLGAFGAHALGPLLAETGRTAVWETAVFYHLTHCVGLLALGLSGRRRWLPVAWCWTAGVVIFSGSLYVLCLSGIGVLGAITPIGGVAFLVGWALLGVRAWRDA